MDKNETTTTVGGATVTVKADVHPVVDSTTTDSKGRVLTIGEPDFLSQFRLVEAVGPSLAANAVYMNMVRALLYIRAIDGSPVVMPQTKGEVDALIQRVGEAGYLALTEKVAEIVGDKGPQVDQLKK